MIYGFTEERMKQSPKRVVMNSTPQENEMQNFLERQVEALLFAADGPLSMSRLTSLAQAPSQTHVRNAIEVISRFYRENNRSFEIVEVAGGFQIATLPEFSGVIKKMYKNKRKSRLTKAALETLAIIAYKQPISRPEIESIRGVNCDGVISTLLDRELVTVSGRGDSLGRPFLYSTTRNFLEYLGLKNYRELPAIDEFESEIEALDILNTSGADDDYEQEESKESAARESEEPDEKEDQD